MIKRTSARRADVLRKFRLACPDPSPADVEAWVARTPLYAADIRRLAVRLASVRRPSGGEGTEALSVEAIVRAWCPRPGDPDLVDLVEEAGTTIPDLADRLDIETEVLLAIATGGYRGPANLRLVDELRTALGVPLAKLVGAMNASAVGPRHGHAHADEPTTDALPTYAELVEASGMGPLRKRHWLRDD